MCALDNDEIRQEGAHVQGRVHLGGRLLAPVLRPAHAEGRQLDGCGVNGANGALSETVGKPGIVRLEDRISGYCFARDS